MTDQFDLLMERNVHPAPAPVPADSAPTNAVDSEAIIVVAPSWDAYSAEAAIPAPDGATAGELETGSLPFSLDIPTSAEPDVQANSGWVEQVSEDSDEVDLFPIASKAVVLAIRETRGPLAEKIGDYEVVDWLDGTLRDLIHAGASDVHLNRSGVTEQLTVLARMDGTLEEIKVINGRDASQIVNKLKTRAQITTTTSAVPADGRVELPLEGFPYRVRAVSLPMFDGGEKIVLRLPSIGELKALDEIGASDENLEAIRALLQRPNGMLLIAGPVGEGKTSTAHIAISEIGMAGKAIITIEDPVERVLAGVSQIEVNDDVGAGFSHIMKYLVRADFDTLFIGEIRDAETAAAAVRMAKAGRRVIATIHATNNVTAMLRLIELSDDTPLSVLDAMNGVISQRLVKKIDHEAGGYRGRHAIHEVLSVTDAFTDRLIENRSIAAIREAAEGSSTTFEDNLRWLVSAGITDQSEARRVVGHDV
jgi:type II secretory ATPase GspE/PulE/Tfp pilus assembly ATPase PilB-like protein